MLSWPDISLLVLLGSFIVTYGVARQITAQIRTGRGPFGDVAVGALHLHHMVWGAGLVLVSGTAAFAFRPEWPANVAPSVGFGVGAALLLDEFALILYLRDVYWSDEGRGSIYAVIVMGLVVGMIALPLAPGQLPHQSRPVVIAWAAVYVLLTAVCLAKGKVFTCMIGLFVPPVVVYGAPRLARPDSPWARVFYSPKQLARTHRRYRPMRTRERRRQQLLDLIERVDRRELAVPHPQSQPDRSRSLSAALPRPRARAAVGRRAPPSSRMAYQPKELKRASSPRTIRAHSKGELRCNPQAALAPNAERRAATASSPACSPHSLCY
jgi:hypothetical protein